MKGKKQPKKAEYTQNQNPSATEQALMEKDCVPLSEVGLKGG